MSVNLEGYRKSYEKAELIEANLPENPFILFRKWFAEVENAGDIAEVNAMTVSTLGEDGFPKSRIVLLKSYSEHGFIFYTNYASEKAEAIYAHPKVCLSFFWPNLERQVIIKATVDKISNEASEAYFNQRPRGSQIGAWASEQSSEITSRKILEERTKELELKFENNVIPKPPHWGGFIAKAESIEFWQGRPNRLHDRIRYEQQLDKWIYKRLAP